ncbi:MAG: ABC transporter ATP-binding protein [Oscillospiraceae bacterium]|nr:ABC transporter ATP-binding protein [Oscillospiraceae bacterium]
MSERQSVLRLDHVTMQFGGVVAVDDLSMEVGEGEIVALIGPNGAGKTTAFNAITGVYEPTNGQVSFLGAPVVRNHPQGKMKKQYKGSDAALYANEPVLRPTPDKLTALGMARTFQNIRLWKTQTVFDNVLIAKHMLKTSSFLSATLHANRAEEADQRAEVAALLEIARALATKPKLLMLDEPAAGMNPQETAELTAFIGRIRTEFGMTILLIEHHMDLVMDISDRIYVIDFGKLIAHGTPEVIQNDPRVIDAYLGVEEDA